MAGLSFGSRLRPLILVVAIVAALGSPASMAAEPQPRGPTLARVIQARRQHSNRLLAIRDVVGTAAGVDRNGRYAVKVYLQKAGVAGIPRELDGVPVVVETTGEFFALEQPAARKPSLPHRPPLFPRPPQFRKPPWSHWPPRPRRPPADRDTSPSVLIVSPADGDVVSGEVTVTAVALDDEGVLSVDFFVDDLFLQSDTDGSDGWSAFWDTSQFEDGTHLLSAVATDTIGQTGSDAIDVVVDNLPGPFSPDGRPAPIGVSTGNENECSAGTIACRVKDAQGNVYALSNNHVYARLNNAEPGEAILQPGLYDTGCTVAYADQTIGLLGAFVPLNFGWRSVNTVDAAIALSSPADLGTATPADGYGTPKSDPAAAYVGQPVQKYGCTTLLTTGAVSGIDATVVVVYGTRMARLSGQIIVGPEPGFIDAGDSGSLLVTHSPDSAADDRKPVGLLFAGNADGSTAIANPIQAVLSALEVTIDGE